MKQDARAGDQESRDRLPAPDRYGIVRMLPDDLSETNRKRIAKFTAFMSLYDFFQDRWVRPRIHRADPARHREILRDAVAGVKDGALLDIGCGTGAAIGLFDPGCGYTGLDLSHAMLRQAARRAKRRGFRSWSLIEASAEQLPLPDASFDFALIDTALHMIPGYEKCIAEAARVLTQGGELVCGNPTTGIDARFDKGWARIAGKRRLHSLTEEDYRAACAGCGLSFIRLATNGGMFYFRARRR